MIIFGGTKGIGSMLAAHYKDQCALSVVGRSPQRHAIKADVSKESSVDAAFEAHRKRWGKDPQVVVNCAAVLGPVGNSWQVPVKEVEETLKINLLGSFIVARAALKRMVRAKGGSIIMFSGGGAAYARPNFGAYGISKAGVLRLVETMAKELHAAGHDHITINAVAPGLVKTGMTAEIINAGKRAGKKDLDEATGVMKSGGTCDREIIDLVDFLIDRRRNKGLTGRLIHVREDYLKLVKKYGGKVPTDIGTLRRIPVEQSL